MWRNVSEFRYGAEIAECSIKKNSAETEDFRPKAPYITSSAFSRFWSWRREMPECTQGRKLGNNDSSRAASIHRGVASYVTQYNLIFYHKTHTFCEHFSIQNMLKLTYGKVEFQIFPGGETPGPPFQRAAALRPGGAAASNAARAGGGREGGATGNESGPPSLQNPATPLTTGIRTFRRSPRMGCLIG